MQFAPGTTAVGFTALTAKLIEGALDHEQIDLEGTQGELDGRVGAPEILAKFGSVIAHNCIPYTVLHTDYQLKMPQRSGNRWKSDGFGKIVSLPRHSTPFYECLNRSRTIAGEFKGPRSK